MLPKSLQSSLKTYKEDTNSIASWLALTAKQCGFSSDLLENNSGAPPSTPHSGQGSKRLKGNARRKAKNAAASSSSESGTTPTYIIKVREFVLLAKCIVDSKNPVIKIPKTLLSALDRAIDLRKDHHEWSKAQTDSRNLTDEVSDANQGHSFFLGILQQTREILQPHMATEILDDFLSKPSGKTKSQNDNELSNKFAYLDVQHPSQAFIDAPNNVPAPKLEQQPRYEVETPKTAEEEYLATHCLFQDVRNIRFAVRQIWHDYKKGMDIVALSVMTDTAIELVRNLENEYRLQYPHKSDYNAIVNLFYEAQCLTRGLDPNHKERPSDPFNFDAFEFVDQCLLSTYVIVSRLQDAFSTEHPPGCQPVVSGRRDLESDWSSKSSREKFEDDNIVLFEAFPDLMLMAMITAKSPLIEDHLLRGFREMAPGKDIPLWLVFAAQCFLDVQHVVKENINQAHADLLETANAIRSSVKQNLEFHKSLHFEDWPKSNDDHFDRILRDIERWVRQDIVAKKFRTLQPDNTLFPDPEPFWLLKQYPLLCGLFTFAVKAMYQDVSIDLVNAWGSVLLTGHLYNAVRQEGLLNTAWKDMELVIMMQSPERMFVGGRPMGLEDYLNRCSLATGFSSSNFASDHRKGAATLSIRGPRTLGKLGEVAEVFTRRYCKHDQPLGWTSKSLRPIIDARFEDASGNASIDADSSAQSSSKSAKTKSPKIKQSTSRTLTKKSEGTRTSVPTVEFLVDEASKLHAESLVLSIDYLRLHRFCWMLLRKVNDACRPQVLDLYGPGYLPKEHHLPFVVIYIFMTALTTSRVAGLLQPRPLVTASECVQSMIEKGAGEVEIKALEQLLGSKIDMGAVEG